MHFITPFKMLVAGPSACGKTTFVLKLIKNRNFSFDGEPIKQIIWCCKRKEFAPNELFSMKHVQIFEGVPDLSDIPSHSLIIFDDLMLESFSKEVAEIFTINSHHSSISVILILQNLYHADKYMRDISLNATYFVLFKNPRDVSQFSYFARQICPDNWKNLEKVYKNVCNIPFTPFIIDLSQKANSILKYKTNIFNEGYFECYATQDEINKHCSEKFETPEQELVLVTTPSA